MKRDPNCKLCPLHRTAQYVCLLGAGPEPCDAMLIGEAPGQREDDSGKPFVGRAGRLLDEMLEEVGLPRETLYITNAVACRPPDNRTPKAREIDACRKWINYQLAMVRPKFVGLLGNVAVQSVLGIKGIKKLRGRPIDRDGIIYFPMYHPSFILRGDGADRPIATQDLRAFKAIVDFGGIPYERAINPVWVDTWDKVEQMLEALTGIVAPDLETTHLYPWADNAQVVTMGFGTAEAEYIVPTMLNPPVWKNPWTPAEIKHIVALATERLEGCITVFQNGKFDALWMRVHYGVRWHNDFDTLLAHYLVDENSRHDLEHLAAIYFGARPWDVDLKIKQGHGPQKTLITYQAQDLHFTRKLYFKLKDLLKKDDAVHRVFNKLLMPVSNLFVEMEAEGCYIDVKRMGEVEAFLTDEIVKAEKKLAKWGDINWSSPKQVGELLYGKLKIKCPVMTKKGNKSTAESALKQIEHPCVTDLLKLRGHSQQRSFFIEGWKPYIRDRRIHPSFKLHGTVTGRPSCEHPNFQQVPRDPMIRSLIIAPPTFELVEADLSQIEMRIAAELSRVPELIHCFQNDIDVHWRTLINSLWDSDGAYVKEAIETVKVLCLQYGLPANRSSSDLLFRLFEGSISKEATNSFLQSCCEIGKNKETRDREWGQGPNFTRLEGWAKVVAKKEFSQKELRVLREYAVSLSASQERKQQGLESIKLSDALQTMSSITPSMAEGIDNCWKEARKKAKAVNFGFLFGMWHKKFIIYARDNYDIHLTEQEAKKHRDKFFQLYPLENWHKHQQRFARHNGYVASLAGRKRRLPHAQDRDDTFERSEALRQAINAPVQSFASDINLMTLLQLREEFSREIVRPVITVHDSILIYVRKDHVERVVHRIEEIMKGPDLFKAFGIRLAVPICGETKLGPWGKGVSLKRWQQ